MKIWKEKKDGVANLQENLEGKEGRSDFRHGCSLATCLELHQILLNFAKEFVSVLFMMFICSLHENIRIGGLVGTQMCTNQLKHKHEAFYFCLF